MHWQHNLASLDSRSILENCILENCILENCEGRHMFLRFLTGRSTAA